MKKIIIMFLSVCAIIITGCTEKKEFTLSQILEGFNFVNNGNVYSLTLQDSTVYSYKFDEKDSKDNTFIVQMNEREIIYYYFQDYIIVESCKYIISTDQSLNCSDKDKENIKLIRFSFDTFNKEMKINEKDLNIPISDVNKKIINGGISYK